MNGTQLASSDHLESIYEEVRKRLIQTAIGRERIAAREELREIYEDTQLDEWRGTGGEPMSALTRSAAEAFIVCLPLSVPTPNVSVDPDGEAALEWHFASGRVLSVSMNGTKEIRFAVIDGHEHFHGNAQFTGGSIPQKIRREMEHE